MVNISGLERGAVLAALYNASVPRGMGFLQHQSDPMTAEEGETIYKSSPTKYFDYLKGRPLKVALDGDDILEDGYDHNNGGRGTFQKIINVLRASGEVNSRVIRKLHDEKMPEAIKHAERMSESKSHFSNGVMTLGADEAGPVLKEKIKAASAGAKNDDAESTQEETKEG